jgi:transposase
MQGGRSCPLKSVMDTGMDRTAVRQRRTRRQWSEADKRRIVAETREPGASIAAVARRHDLNANQLFGWRRQYDAAARPAPTHEPVFVAIDMAGDEKRSGAAVSTLSASDGLPPPARVEGRHGVIEIDLPCGARLRCDARVNQRALAMVIGVLTMKA